MTGARPPVGVLLPRRDFLLVLCVAPVVVPRGTFSPAIDTSTSAAPDAGRAVVEYRGWIVHASDRARLEAGALQ